jgi:hypothetical protein
MTDFIIEASKFSPGSLPPGFPHPQEMNIPSFKKQRFQSFPRLVVWSILPMALWYIAANGLAYYLSSNQSWVGVHQNALVIYALVTLYAVPWVLTIITGFISWGYALSMYGSVRGTMRAFGIFFIQWLAVGSMTLASIHLHYIHFYTEHFYA